MFVHSSFSLFANISLDGHALTKQFKSWHRCRVPSQLGCLQNRDLLVCLQRLSWTLISLSRFQLKTLHQWISNLAQRLNTIIIGLLSKLFCLFICPSACLQIFSVCFQGAIYMFPVHATTLCRATWDWLMPCDMILSYLMRLLCFNATLCHRVSWCTWPLHVVTDTTVTHLSWNYDFCNNCTSPGVHIH